MSAEKLLAGIVRHLGTDVVAARAVAKSTYENG
jgi:hypothetical protein